MTTEIVAMEREIESLRLSADALVAQIATMSSADEALEARARTQAIKAWATAHRRLEEIRLDLVRVEAHALARVVRLGGDDLLGVAARSAGRRFASLSPAELDELIQRYAHSTTAIGVHRAAMLTESLAAARQRGVETASRPDLPHVRTTEGLGDPDDVLDDFPDVSAALGAVLADHTRAGVPFTVDEVANEVLEASGARYDDDAAVLEGVREVVRSAIRKAPVVKVGDRELPRTITTRTAFTEVNMSASAMFVRIPVENALVGHLDDMISMREAALRADSRRLDDLLQLRMDLERVPGCTPESRIIDLLRASDRSAGVAA